jgi:hypothetical protein
MKIKNQPSKIFLFNALKLLQSNMTDQWTDALNVGAHTQKTDALKEPNVFTTTEWTDAKKF